MSAHDPRMQGFRRQQPVEDVLRLIDERVAGPLAGEAAPLRAAAERVLAEDVRAPIDLPPFERSAMDGYAVRAEETFGASAYAPIALRLVGSSMPGRPFEGRVGAGEAVRIMTGAPLPAGADAVLKAEDARAEGDRVEALSPVTPRKNVSAPGDDVRAGDVLLRAGRRLRPQDVAILSSLGIASVAVVRRPRVDVIVTGSELLPAGTPPEGARIPDANGPMLAALVARDGGIARERPIVRDDVDALRAALCEAAGDVLLLSGGSSVGIEDYVPRIVAELGELPVHGVAMRPASPTGVGFFDGRRPVFLLPGNPVSCLCAYDFFAGRAIRALGGLSRAWPYRAAAMPLERKIASQAGRTDYARVEVIDGKAAPLLVSGASILSSAVRAHGFVVVPPELEGHAAGETVTVWLYD